MIPRRSSVRCARLIRGSLNDGVPLAMASTPVSALHPDANAFKMSRTPTVAVVELGSWPVLPIFRYLANLGKIDQTELLQTFNMGVGMILVVPAKNVRKVESELRRRRQKFYSIGHIKTISGSPRVSYTGKLPL